MEVLRTKEYMSERRENSLRMLDKMQEESRLVQDTPGITRKVIHVGDMSITSLAFGHDGDVARVEETHFRKSLLMCSGKARIDYDDGRVMHLDDINDLVAIPQNVPYTVTALEDDTAVVIKMSENKTVN